MSNTYNNSYAILGLSCRKNTIACTSNHKFFPLYAPIYTKPNNFNACKYYLHEYSSKTDPTIIQKIKKRVHQEREEKRDKYHSEEEERQRRQQIQQYRSGNCPTC